MVRNSGHIQLIFELGIWLFLFGTVHYTCSSLVFHRMSCNKKPWKMYIYFHFEHLEHHDLSLNSLWCWNITDCTPLLLPSLYYIFCRKIPKPFTKLHISIFSSIYSLFSGCKVKVASISQAKDHLQNIVLRTEKNCYFAENLSSGALVLLSGTSETDVHYFFPRHSRKVLK